MGLLLLPGCPIWLLLTVSVGVLATAPMGLLRARRAGAQLADLHRSISAILMGALMLLAVASIGAAAEATISPVSATPGHPGHAGMGDLLLVIGIPYLALAVATVVVELRRRNFPVAAESLLAGAMIVVMAAM